MRGHKRIARARDPRDQNLRRHPRNHALRVPQTRGIAPICDQHPLRPRRVEVEYLVNTVKTELDRSRDVIPPAAVKEYEEAIAAYQSLLEHAR